jgi:hypothetical protein
MLEQVLSDGEQATLRQHGVINESEVAVKIGDIYLAVDVVSNERRTINPNSVLSESKKVLRG